MIIYQAYYHSADDGCVIGWFSRKRDAERWHREAVRGHGHNGPDGVERIVFPTKKSDVIRWLDNHLNRDNG